MKLNIFTVSNQNTKDLCMELNIPLPIALEGGSELCLQEDVDPSTYGFIVITKSDPIEVENDTYNCQHRLVYNYRTWEYSLIKK